MDITRLLLDQYSQLFIVSLIVLYFLPSTSVLSFHIDTVLTLSIVPTVEPLYITVIFLFQKYWQKTLHSSLRNSIWSISCSCHSNNARNIELWHNNDVIMGTMTSQITSLKIVYSTVYSGTDQRNHQSSASLAFCGEFTGDRWIPRTNGQ